MAVELVVSGGKAPTGLHFDADGELFVCGGSDGRIYVATGTGLTETTNPGGAPSSLAADAEGQMFVCDAAIGAVAHLKADGTYDPILTEYEGTPLKGPHSLVFDSTGQMYFTDAGPAGETGLFAPHGSVYMVTSPGSERMLRPVALDCLARPTGVALSPAEAAVYVCEQAANRILRFTQRPAGVYHATVFHQFAGRLGPSAIVCDHSREGLLYVARPEAPDCSDKGVISVLSPEGVVMREWEVPGPDVSSLALSPDAKYLYFTDATNNKVYRMLL